MNVDPSRLFNLFYRLSAVSGSLYRDGDAGLPPTEVRPTPDERASDENASQCEPTSRANSQVARDLIKKGQALSSQGPELLRSRSDRGRAGWSGARSPSPVGSDRHRHGDVVMYDPQADLARGNPPGIGSYL